MSVPEEITIPPGKIQFFNNFVPPLDDGSYAIKVEQKLDFPDHHRAAGSDTSFSHEQVFHVTPRRFNLAPGDLHAVYPPGNSEGVFGLSLPHAVLRKRSLPWERRVGSGSENPRLPWLAVLLFHDGQAPEIRTVPLADIAGTAGDNPKNGVLRPEITVRPDLEAEAGGQAMVIDVPGNQFDAIAPSLEDLPFLAHVRQVNTGDKEILGLDVDGWFSVVLGNRVGKTGLNTAHVVSLEGLTGFLRRDPAKGPRRTIPAGAAVRLVSLASWSWTEKAAKPGNFELLMDGLDVGSLSVPAPSFSATPQDPERTAMAELVTKALEQGYVPLAYEMRSGERTAGWYRGPLLPVRTSPLQDDDSTARDPYESAEAALIYDPRIGMFDASYAVAWQIGRLLALADAQFSSALARWRQQGQVVADRLLEREVLRRRFNEAQLFTSLSEILGEKDRERQRAMLIQLVRELADSQAFSKALSTLVVPTNGTRSSPLEVIRAAPDSKTRLARGFRELSEGELDELDRIPPGPERDQRFAEMLLQPAELRVI